VAQFDVWEKEYRDPKLITNSDEPQLDFKHFIKWLRKTEHVDLDGLRVLDLGSGTGKNSLFLAERGSEVTGIELSTTAVKIAEQRAQERGLFAEFIEGSFGNKFNFKDNGFDLIIDVVSSMSLSDKERTKYLSECTRVLKPGGHMFVKTLCVDGDKNAQWLLEHYPGKEKNTYVMPETGIIERVFSEEDIRSLYGEQFDIQKLERKHSYTIMDGKPFKRQFWLAYLRKN
jgi:ubiquinone/menaquinone biosynthesis C-methylase UbiE